MSWLQDAKLDGVVRGFYDSIRLSYRYEKVMSTLVSRLSPRLVDSVRIYRELQQRDGEPLKNQVNVISEGDYLKNRGEISAQNTTWLRNAFEFLHYARDSSQDIQPILLYYSWLFFATFFKRTLFLWESSPRGHGIHAIGEGSLDLVKIKFSRGSGSFDRLVDCLTLLGFPTIFGKWLPIPVPEKRSLRFEPNDLQHSFSSKGPYCLAQLLEFKVGDFLSEARAQRQFCGFHVN